ncbi:MAG TPA: zf-TFIIB domain-containing protein [Gemmatimonadaceae bacterium]|nr:zf-TFIIB domain-containing protein [Gemmatimonadaceae bacterium]
MPQHQLDESEETMSTDEKPSRNEDEYFVKRDAEFIRERRERLDEERRRLERTSHYNKCPRCGIDLVERDHNGVKIDQCATCGGMWLDRGELEIIEESDRHAPGFIHNLIGLIRG